MTTIVGRNCGKLMRRGVGGHGAPLMPRIWPESSRAAKRLWLEYLLVRLRWLESSRLRAVASGGEQPRHHREGRKHQEGQGMRGLKHGGGNDRGGPQQRVCDLQVFAHDDLQWMRWQTSAC